MLSGDNEAFGSGARSFKPWRYLAELNTPRLVLWCYLIWYLFVLGRYFDPSPRLWLTSLGIAIIIGTALYLSTARAGRTPTRLEPWQIARFYLMPFCVSSFAALVKGRDFILVFYPSLADNVRAVTACAAFVTLTSIARLLR